MTEIHSRIARSRGAAVAGPVAALVLAAGTLAGCGDAGATITRLTVGTPGPDPYTQASGTDETDVKKRPRAGGTATGDSPGLYGGTRREASCDPGALIAFLQAEPEKAKAWAGAQDIPVADIPRYVSRLTPVLLRTDTLVTNHGYRDGRATGGPAVLQAGMGVMVNGHGVPAVKCNCGNPLTPPEQKISPDGASYTGRSWPGFDERKVTEIQPSDSGKGTIVTFVLVDPEGTMGFERPRATEGEADGPPAALPATETADATGGPPAPQESGGQPSGPVSPGTEVPGTEPTGTDSSAGPGTDPSTGPTGTGVPGGDGGTHSTPSVASREAGTGDGGDPPDERTGGPADLPRAPVSLPPATLRAPALP